MRERGAEAATTQMGRMGAADTSTPLPAAPLDLQGDPDLGRTVAEDGVGLAVFAPGDRGLVIDRPDGHGAASVVDLFDELRVHRAPMRRVDISPCLSHDLGWMHRASSLENAQL